MFKACDIVLYPALKVSTVFSLTCLLCEASESFTEQQDLHWDEIIHSV